MNSHPLFIVVIGASAGGLDALCELVAQLPEEAPFSVFTIMHVSAKGIEDLLTRRLQQFTPLRCRVAADGDTIDKGSVYIAPADHHMVIKEGSIKITDGPHENRWRPSIDVTFRSAAVAYGERAIGIILTGLLDDGTAGMMAIKKCGGTCIVQDPNEAAYPDMPLSVMANMDVDYCLPLTQMGFIIDDVVHHKGIKGIAVPQEISAEAAIAEKTISGIDYVAPLGKQSLYTCPDCGGELWEIKENGFHRYRCHIGHAYSENDLLKKQSEQLESTLWIALRMMEERHNLLSRIGAEELRRGLNSIGTVHMKRAEELKMHIQRLKRLLFDTREA